MVDAAVISVLAVLHVTFAVGWLGGVLFFVSSIGPGVRKMSPASSVEFSAKVGPRLTRFYAITGTLTLIFGLGLLFADFGTDVSTWPVSLEVGFTMGLLAYITGLAVTIPASIRLDKITKKMLESPTPGPPPAEFVQSLKRLSMGAVVIAALLFLALIFMVGTAFPL